LLPEILNIKAFRNTVDISNSLNIIKENVLSSRLRFSGDGKNGEEGFRLLLRFQL
jgi:hypothetical protein